MFHRHPGIRSQPLVATRRWQGPTQLGFQVRPRAIVQGPNVRKLGNHGHQDHGPLSAIRRLLGWLAGRRP